MTQGLQNASLDHAAMEKLAAQIVRDFATVCAKLKDLRQPIETIQSWFRAHRRGSTSLLGCASFREFCTKRLRRDESTVYRMLGVNSTAVREAKWLDAQNVPLPAGKFRIILADCPWDYGQPGLRRYGHAAYHYPTMPIEELCALKVGEIAMGDSVLFLWVTSPMLEKSFKVIAAWGFLYKESFVWDKVKHVCGHYHSVRHELLLICTRGACTPDVGKRFGSVQVIERTGHSEKPERFREIIDELYQPRRDGRVDRIELFARRPPPPNWEAWGNECPQCPPLAAGDALALAPFARKPIPSMLRPWINKIHRGDCVEVMGQMPEKSIDVIVTSPPYNIRNSTGGGMRNNGGGRWKNCGLLKGYDGLPDDMPHAEYVAWQRRCLTEMMRVLKDDGAIFYNHKPRVQGGLWQDRRDIVEGFPVREEIIWERAGGINFNPGYFVPTYEVIYLICKPAFSLAAGANGLGAVWHIPQETGNPHPAPFPLELARLCIESTDAQVVLDPFSGSGTSAVAAEQLGRHWIGIEQSQKYIVAANERLARASLQKNELCNSPRERSAGTGLPGDQRRAGQFT